MREPLDNKADRPAHSTGLVERFPQRVGNRLVSDRPLTAQETRVRIEERELLDRAKEFRRQKKGR